MKPSYQDVRKLATKYISSRFGLNPPTLEELNITVDEFLELPRYHYLNNKLKSSLKRDLIDLFSN
jgi:hypothetical protein